MYFKKKYKQKGGSISEIQTSSPVQNIITMDETTVSEALDEDVNNIIIFPGLPASKKGSRALVHSENFNKGLVSLRN